MTEGWSNGMHLLSSLIKGSSIPLRWFWRRLNRRGSPVDGHTINLPFIAYKSSIILVNGSNNSLRVIETEVLTRRSRRISKEMKSEKHCLPKWENEETSKLIKKTKTKSSQLLDQRTVGKQLHQPNSLDTDCNHLGD